MKKFKGLAAILVVLVIVAGVVITIESIKTNRQEASLYQLSSNRATPVRVCNPNRLGLNGQEIQGTTPWIQITSPNGGETYALAGQYDTTWTTCNTPSTVIPSISLVYAPTNVVIQALTVNHNAQYGWTKFVLPRTLPSQYALGNNFKLQLSETINGQTISTESANTFTIDSEAVSANGASNGVYNGGVATFTIPFLVKAEGAAIYVPKTVSSGNPTGGGCSPNSDNVMFCVFGISGANFTLGGGVLTQVGNVATLTSNGNYKIPIGQSASFVLKVTINSLQHGDYDAFLTSVPWSLSDIPVSSGYGNNPLTQFFVLPIEPNPNSNLLNASVSVP